MRQKLFIFLGLIFLALLLVGLNAASYVQKEKVPDSEANPNRSTYNTGATGTRAFFDLLNETGRRSVRWQEAPLALLSSRKDTPQTFVVVGHLQNDFTDEEREHLLRWVSDGGKLVVIDREPHRKLLSTTANWSVQTAQVESVPFATDPSNRPQMTDKVTAGKPVQPSIYTRNINAVQPSRFASSVKLEYFGAAGDGDFKTSSESAPPQYSTVPEKSGNFKVATPTPVFQNEDEEYDEPPPPPPQKQTGAGRGSGGQGSGDRIGSAPPKALPAPPMSEVETPAQNAPVVHLANKDKTLLVDFPYGSGQIVYLSDPYMISNAGISQVDNAQMAINVVASRGGTIAFDEFHHGYGANENRVLAYFAGTPVAAIFVQILLLIGVVLFTQSRRFARALPAAEPNRLSKLEYVSAMAELQQRTRAYDLALENIYSEFRRTMARFVGVDNFQTSRKDLARLIAEKANLDAVELENLMFKCEDIIHGEPTGKKEILHLTSRLREIEEKLGLKRQRTARKGM
ncbi:MAG TPA: DUF4350 domain-containing protein [Pyrinomonadaceae bacterium]|jgi:hypothetical protein